MQKIINYIIIGLAIAFAITIREHYRSEIERTEQNLYALEESITHYQNELGECVSSIQALRLERDELLRLRSEDAEKIRRLGIKLRRVESVAQNGTTSRVEIKVPVRDTLILTDSVKEFSWSDRWVEIEGRIEQDSLSCRVISHDTLFQVLHRVPRRFLFIKWGTKALRQEIISKNPHTKVVYAEYIKVEK